MTFPTVGNRPPQTAPRLMARRPSAPLAPKRAQFKLRVLGALLVAAVAASSVVVSPTPVSAASASAEAVLEEQFILQFNAERAARGAPPIRFDRSLQVASRRWSDTMANGNSLYHSSDGRAEIVGYGGWSGQVTEAFMKSPAHRNLIVDPNLAIAGAGVTCDASGRLWVTVQFFRADKRLPTLSSSAGGPVVTPARSGSSCQDSSNIGGVRRLYVAFFRRESDQGGLSYWVGRRDSGTSLVEIADFFETSDEFQATYGSLNNHDFVALVYRNVLGRAPDGGGLSYWVGRLNSGTSRGAMMVGFSDGPEFIARSGIA